MYGRVYSGMTKGIEGLLVAVETDISPGLPGITLIGDLSGQVKEASERVRTALKNIDINLPPQRITINLYPADIRKTGTAFDLAISVSVMISMGVISDIGRVEGSCFIGELSLDGKVMSVPGVLPLVHFAALNGFKRVVVPRENKEEAALIDNIDIIPVSDLCELIGYLIGDSIIEPYVQNKKFVNGNTAFDYDIGMLKGQELIKKGLTVSIAGRHHILMTGEAGSGKSLSAKCIPGIMPPLNYGERLELTKIYSSAGLLGKELKLIDKRPFRSPHSNSTESSLIGGGNNPKPGEISLADKGVLFLDEFPEFKRNVIESLRQPMEDKKVLISRVGQSVEYPSDFLLVAARNNCPCGFYPDRNKCRCTMREIVKYKNKISHPIMDRIDIRLDIRKVPYEVMLDNKGTEGSEEIRHKIMVAMDRQKRRYIDEAFDYNSEIPQDMIFKYVKMDNRLWRFFKEQIKEKEVSARGTFKMLRMIRSIADTDDREDIREEDVCEALLYRNEETDIYTM